MNKPGSINQAPVHPELSLVLHSNFRAEVSKGWEQLGQRAQSSSSKNVRAEGQECQEESSSSWFHVTSYLCVEAICEHMAETEKRHLDTSWLGPLDYQLTPPHALP